MLEILSTWRRSMKYARIRLYRYALCIGTRLALLNWVYRHRASVFVRCVAGMTNYRIGSNI